MIVRSLIPIPWLEDNLATLGLSTTLFGSRSPSPLLGCANCQGAAAPQLPASSNRYIVKQCNLRLVSPKIIMPSAASQSAAGTLSFCFVLFPRVQIATVDRGHFHPTRQESDILPTSIGRGRKQPATIRALPGAEIRIA